MFSFWELVILNKYNFRMMQLDLFESKNIAILRLAESDATEVIRIPGWLKIGKRVDCILLFYY